MSIARQGKAPLLVALTLLATGCATVDTLNPFASGTPKNKPAELSAIQAASELRTQWKSSVGTSGEYTFTPVVVDSSVYAAARDGSITRFDSGRQAWRISAGQVLSGGVGSDGKVVVVGTPKGDVLAFDATNGRELWKTRVSSEILAAPAVGEGLAIVRSGDSRVFAFEVADGKRRWVYQRSTPNLSLRSSVGVVLAGTHTLAGFPGGKLVAIANNNGAAVWDVTVALPKGATELERVADVTSSPVISDTMVCAAAFQGRAACFDIGTGNVVWARDISSSAGMDVDKRYAYVTDDKGAVHAFDRSTGASVWKQDKLFMRGLSRPLALGEQIAVADYQGVVHLLRREDGALVGRATTDGSAVRAEPARLGGGVLIQTANGGLYALEAK
jgi:outer membrane protein assembly factor BamB